ncbi:ABC transporter ATP-binding protein [Actinotalea sp.]|uniref:ABC transporter ATP-binding protein n=1 Tax=Actinotalea sp. TaxID=1872145 RepID=UPI002C5846A3|nr:ABC transporter ATP-binding protein [Actinotalea sp.]HQY33045.1 ABC transporter ATP-binding protein [Actinotalea sp.]HRA51016.1 ABC transporter ATP-binding protein [Actinotalea sp.]
MAVTTTATRTTTRTGHPVAIRGVGRTFAPRDRHGRAAEVLADVDLEVAAGEVVALIGASGCGKSTLLRQVVGLDTPTTGTILIDGTPVDGVDSRCAVGFQEPRLLPWRTLAQNVALGLPRGGRGQTAGGRSASRGEARREGARRVAELLALVGLGEATALRPRQVSGGMAQRAALARALARNPGVLVLDEPFGALDALTRLRMQDLLLDVHAAEPTTVLLVTHDVDEALYLADRVVLLGRPDGAPGAGPAGVRRVVTVPGARPRDRGDAELALLRAELLDGLGVPSHHVAHDPDQHHSI